MCSRRHLAQGIHDTSIKLASAALALTRSGGVWENANRIAHDQVVDVLEGKGTIVTTAEGEVAVELRPLAEKVRDALDANGVHLFDSVPAASLDRRFVLFRSVDLARAQDATRLLDALGKWLPFATVAVFAGAIALSTHRRRRLGYSALALAATMVVLTIALAVGRAFYLDRVGRRHLARGGGGAVRRALHSRCGDGSASSSGSRSRCGSRPGSPRSRKLIAREREVREATRRGRPRARPGVGRLGRDRRGPVVGRLGSAQPADACSASSWCWSSGSSGCARWADRRGRRTEPGRTRELSRLRSRGARARRARLAATRRAVPRR